MGLPFIWLDFGNTAMACLEEYMSLSKEVPITYRQNYIACYVES